jgi:hypothetical protein
LYQYSQSQPLQTVEFLMAVILVLLLLLEGRHRDMTVCEERHKSKRCSTALRSSSSGAAVVLTMLSESKSESRSEE